MKKVLWISRHPLDEKAKNKIGDATFVEEPIVFPANGNEGVALLLEKSKKFDLIGGVFPAQVWVALLRKAIRGEKVPHIFCVVSVPRVAEDGKTRIFEFDHIEEI